MLWIVSFLFLFFFLPTTAHHMKIVPPNFGYVEEGIFRCGAPEPQHFSFLASLQLKTCVLLTDTQDEAFVRWMQESGIAILCPLAAATMTQVTASYYGGGPAPTAMAMAGGGMLGPTAGPSAPAAAGPTGTNTVAGTALRGEGSPLTTNLTDSGLTAATVTPAMASTPHDALGDYASGAVANASSFAAAAAAAAAGAAVGGANASAPALPGEFGPLNALGATLSSSGVLADTDSLFAAATGTTANAEGISEALSADGAASHGLGSGATLPLSTVMAVAAREGGGSVDREDSRPTALSTTLPHTSVPELSEGAASRPPVTSQPPQPSNMTRFLRENVPNDKYVNTAASLRTPASPGAPNELPLMAANTRRVAPASAWQLQPTPMYVGGYGVIPGAAPSTAAAAMQRGLMTLSEPVVVSILHVLLDPKYYPLLVTCSKGRYRTGIVCGCLRKMQQWNLVSILEEYRRFAGDKSRAENEEFIELFDKDLVSLELEDGRHPTILYNSS